MRGLFCMAVLRPDALGFERGPPALGFSVRQAPRRRISSSPSGASVCSRCSRRRACDPQPMTAGVRAAGARRVAVSVLRGLRVRLNHGHGWLYARSGGRLGGSVGGHPVLLLTTVGRRSGRKRRTPVQYERLGGDLVVVGAGGGSAEPPAWWLNLEADPEVEVQLGADRWGARAETAGPKRRAELWSALTVANPSIASAQAKAGRQLPVVVLSRRAQERI